MFDCLPDGFGVHAEVRWMSLSRSPLISFQGSFSIMLQKDTFNGLNISHVIKNAGSKL